VLKSETQKQLKKYDDYKKFNIHPNDQNELQIDFVESSDLNRNIQSEENMNVANDILSNIEYNLQTCYGRKNQDCQIHTKNNIYDKKSKDQYCKTIESQFESSTCKRMSNKDSNNNTYINQKQSTTTNHLLSGVHYPMVNLYTHNFTLKCWTDVF